MARHVQPATPGKQHRLKIILAMFVVACFAASGSTLAYAALTGGAPLPPCSQTDDGSNRTIVCPDPVVVTPTATVTATGPTTTATVTTTTTGTVTVSPSSSATTTAPPTGSATPSSTPTPTVTPTTTAPVAGFPSASNTGVPVGTVLHAVKSGDSGPCWNVANGAFNITCTTTIDSFNIPFVVNVFANNVTITKTKIKGASYYTVKTCDCPTYYSGLNLTDDDIDGGSSAASQSIAVMGNPNAIYLRDNFHGFASSGPRLDDGDLLQDSYIHDFVCQKPDHSAGTSINGGGANLQIIHNTVDINTTAAGCASAAIELSPQDFNGSLNNVTISNNWVAGGAYCMYVAESNTPSTNIHVTNNVFSKKYNPQCGLFGPVAELQSGNGNTFTGNAYDDGTLISG